MQKLLLLVFIYVLPAKANIVPNFTTGTMSSTTNTQTTITESITSKDYATGYEYTVTGTGIEHDGGSMSPDATSVSGTVGGHSYTWTGANMETKPKWSLADPTSGNAFQFTETYSGPGLQNVTNINRVIETESVVISTSVFQ